MPHRISLLMVTCFIVLAVAAGPATTQTTDALAPPATIKAPGVPYLPPAAPRQGGDTVADALDIPDLPYTDDGTTEGFAHDYTATCFSNATAPDVVYRLVVPAEVTRLDVSLCGSTYDTGLIVFDAQMTQVGCNDDFCSLQSEIDAQPVTPGAVFYIVVTGYSGSAGIYTLTVAPPPPPYELICPEIPDQHEWEPALDDNYVDRFNGGCNSPPYYPFQRIEGASGDCGIPVGTNIWCGVSGWYLSAGTNTRDTDWYTLIVGPTGVIEIVADAEYASYIFELAGDCTNVSVAQQATAGPHAEAFMTITGTAGATKWFWVGPTVFVSPDGTREYDYIVWFEGLEPIWHPATTAATWGTLKALFR